MKLPTYQKIISYLEFIRFTEFNPKEKEMELDQIRINIRETFLEYFENVKIKIEENLQDWLLKISAH